MIEIHDLVIGENELQGMAGDKSLDALLARIENRMSFGMINDEFDLAACYACFLAVGYVFNDANKRTAFACMDVCLSLNDIELNYDHREVGDLISFKDEQTSIQAKAVRLFASLKTWPTARKRA